MFPSAAPALRQLRPVHNAGDDDLDIQQTTQRAALTYLHREPVKKTFNWWLLGTAGVPHFCLPKLQ
jgi:hypothetical protein